MFTNLDITDMETCYKLFRRELVQAIELKEERFGFEPECPCPRTVRGSVPRIVPPSWGGGLDLNEPQDHVAVAHLACAGWRDASNAATKMEMPIIALI